MWRLRVAWAPLPARSGALARILLRGCQAGVARAVGGGLAVQVCW